MEAVVKRPIGLSVLVWVCVYLRCFSAARLRGLTGLVLIWVNVRCFMEALLDVFVV